MLVLAVKLTSLFVLLWFGFILVAKLIRGLPASTLNIAIPAAAAVAFAWSMGWLSQ